MIYLNSFTIHFVSHFAGYVFVYLFTAPCFLQVCHMNIIVSVVLCVSRRAGINKQQLYFVMDNYLYE